MSFGSGAGSDAFAWEVTERITACQDKAPHTADYIKRRVEIDSALYTRSRGKLRDEGLLIGERKLQDSQFADSAMLFSLIRFLAYSLIRRFED